MQDFDFPRSLRSSAAVAARKGLLHQPHMGPLAQFVANLRCGHPDCEFPDFDPLDGGVAAEILFLFEKPGAMTSGEKQGSGFISRNNDDPTAEATFYFMKKAEVPRSFTVTWNIIPGWNGTRKTSAREVAGGVASLRSLLPLLPRLHTIVLVGKKAQRATSTVGALGLRTFTSAHPSPLVRARHPGIWQTIPEVWAQALPKKNR
jgi:hypothetical protein